jgi:hypothetical protein
MLFAGERSIALTSRLAAVPIVLAPFFGLSLGAALAWVAAPELARAEGPILVSRTFAVVVAFAGLVWAPVLGYFVAFHGDWSYLYLVPWHRIPSAVDLALVFAASVAVLCGFLVAVNPVRKRRFVPLLAVIVIPAFILLGALPLIARRLAVSATYAQFHGDFGTEPIGATSLGKGVLTMDALLVVAMAWTARSLATMGSSGRN